MPTFESPALYVDLSRLPPPQVIEEIDYEKLVQVYKNEVLAKEPRLEKALQLEQSPTNIILEAEAYGEMIVRSRINAAARAVLLPYATGADLDNLAAFYNVERMRTPEDRTTNPPTPAKVESDARLRRRVQLKAEAFTTAGSEGAYVYHAMTASLGIRDATAKMTAPGTVTVALMAEGANPVVTDAQLDAVKARLFHPAIKPLTDEVVVIRGKKIDTAIKAELTLYPGPSAGLVLSDTNKAIQDLRGRIGWIGRDLQRSAIISKLLVEGVFDVALETPAVDLVANNQSYVWITSAEVTVNTLRTE